MSAHRPTDVIVAGLHLNRVDDNGASWEFISIDGWHTGPGVAVVQAQRIVDHGQFAQPSHRTGRILIITGQIRAWDRSPVARALDRLAALLADGNLGRFEFHDREQPMKWADVQLYDEPTVTWRGGPYARYQLQLLVPSAYRFGVTSTASTGFAVDPEGSGLTYPLFTPAGVLDFANALSGDTGIVSVHNLGTAAARPRFTIAGPTPPGGFTIIEMGTGNTLAYLGDVPEGSELVIDSRDASAVIDGLADRTGDLVVNGTWPLVPAAGERGYLFQPAGGTSAAVLTVDCTSTYW